MDPSLTRLDGALSLWSCAIAMVFRMIQCVFQCFLLTSSILMLRRTVLVLRTSSYVSSTVSESIFRREVSLITFFVFYVMHYVCRMSFFGFLGVTRCCR